MFITNKEGNSEARDAQLVDLAAKAIYVDNFSKAESLLLKVIKNTPDPYLYQYQEAGKLVIKFWHNQEVNQYCSWQKKQGINQEILWHKSAYPRAYYFLGFLKNKTGEYEQALYYLEQGIKLESSNPKFLLEKAKALGALGLFEQALSIYESFKNTGPHISKYDIAKALQERASLLLTMGKVDEAEQSYQESLNWETDNAIVVSQLNKIQDLKENKSGEQYSSKLTDNPTYQSFLEQSFINQFKAQQKSQSTGFTILKNRGYLLIILTLFLIIFPVIISLFS